VGLLHVLTEEEYGHILHLASILLLGYLLPCSTGGDYYLLQNLPRVAGGNVDIEDLVFQLPLNERVAKSIRHLDAGDFGEIGSLTDPYLDVAFDSFLNDGVAPLLAGRRFHRQQVDVLHIFAMAIHPTADTDLIPQSCRYLKSRGRVFWQKAQDLMESWHYAAQFQLHFGHRVRIIQLILRNIVLPPVEDNSENASSPLLYGALPHLQASLRGFALGASTQWDAHLAYSCMVTISVQTQNNRLIQDDWDNILHHMVDDKVKYGCNCCDTKRMLPVWTALARVQEDDESGLCPHRARGELLAAFIVRTCASRGRVELALVQKLTVSLTDAIEWQLDMWTKTSDIDSHGSDKPHPPCMLASLLFAAKHVFLFQPSKLKQEDEDPCKDLLHSGIRLLRHPNLGIANEAAGLLFYAVLHDKGIRMADFAPLIFSSILFCLENSTPLLPLPDVIGVASEQAPQYGLVIFSKLVECLDSGNATDLIFRSIAAVSLNCPAISYNGLDSLTRLLTSEKGVKGIYLVQAILSSRQARFFAGIDDSGGTAISQFLSLAIVDNWTRYRAARDALVAGNFKIAGEIFKRLLTYTESERNYLWILALQKVSAAELALSAKGAMGLSSAVTMMRSSLSYFQSIGSVDGVDNDDFIFQLRFLNLRVDFLDLITVLRQFAGEMRLTGSGPAKHTRNHIHLGKLVRAFEALAMRFREIYHQHAVVFSFQSRSALQVCRGLALFVTKAARAVFSDVLPVSAKHLSLDFLSAFRHPMASLINRLNEQVLQPMESAIDPFTRSAALLEVIEAVLVTPVPIPRDFLLPGPKHTATLNLSTSSNLTDSLIVVWPSLGVEFQARGRIPSGILTHSTAPIWTVLLWLRAVHVAPLNEEDGTSGDNKEEEAPNTVQTSVNPRIPDVAGISPWTTDISSKGHFSFDVDLPPFMDEGLFRVECTIGCQDALGQQWQIPCDRTSLAVRVERTR
jgi:hypothetical protein